VLNYEIGNLTTPTASFQLAPAGVNGAADTVATLQPNAFGSTATGFGSINYFAGIGLHAGLGCATKVASSGRGCGPGALAGGISAASGPISKGVEYGRRSSRP
jgi:hypothetical protein